MRNDMVCPRRADGRAAVARVRQEAALAGWSLADTPAVPIRPTAPTLRVERPTPSYRRLLEGAAEFVSRLFAARRPGFGTG